MFLTIANQGIAPVESFTVLGLSTARGQSDKIGQFGSGAKHGVLTCLRNNITPQVFLGVEPLEFTTERGEMAGKAYDRVLYSWRGNVERSSMVLEFGSLDWTKLEMGLREFISNALDSVNGDATKVIVKITDKPFSHANTTSVCIPLTPSVEQYAQNLASNFLQWREGYDPTKCILSKVKQSNCRLYRKGVFVRETATQSLFDYNLGDETKIDESRNLSDSAVCDTLARHWKTASVAELTDILKRMETGEVTSKIIEGSLYSFYMRPIESKYVANWKAAYSAVFGNACVATSKDTHLIDLARRKHIAYVILPENWADSLIESNAAKSLKDGLKNHGVDHNGRMTRSASPALLARVMKVWQKLESKGLTSNRPFPQVKSFSAPMDAGAEVMGYYDTDTQTVCIGDGYQSNLQTILEELAHHITQANDETRDFQDYAFKCAAAFMKR